MRINFLDRPHKDIEYIRQVKQELLEAEEIKNVK